MAIRVVGGDFVEATETDLTLAVELLVTGLSFGTIPLRVVAVSYAGLEERRNSFNIQSSLEDIAGSNPLPSTSAMPCELNWSNGV